MAISVLILRFSPTNKMLAVNNNEIHELQQLKDGQVYDNGYQEEDSDTSANMTQISVSLWQQCLNTQRVKMATEASSRISTSLIVAISFLLLALGYFLGYYLEALYQLDLVIVPVVGTLIFLIIVLTLVLDWQPRCWDEISFKVEFS